jgi:hypothetical protein
MIVHLETKDWLTPLQYAKKNKVSKQVVNSWISRGRLETKYIKDWGLRLIRVDKVPS